MKNQKSPLRLLIIAIACAAGLTATAQTTVQTPSAATAPADNAKATVAMAAEKAPAIEGFLFTDTTAQLDGMTLRLAYTDLTDKDVISQRLTKAGYAVATVEQMQKAFAGKTMTPPSPKHHPVGLVSNAKQVADNAKPESGKASTAAASVPTPSST